MFEWIRGLRKSTAPARKLRSRGEGADAERVELAEFAPGILPFLGLTAYLQLELYEAATRAVSGAPTLEAKNVLARVAGLTLAKHQRLTDEIKDRGAEPHVAMSPYSTVIDAYVERIDTPDWHQHVLSLYLVGGLFDDFFASLAGGLKDGFKGDAIKILSTDSGRAELKVLLEGALAADEPLSSWLALWGRRLVGDTLLVSRAVLTLSERRAFDEELVEPVFTELIADHIRRMDGLGLTA
ncbi:ferritin-like domain-containing protein [Leucobacter allii]|uniref:Ferritin-like domain-containing protein n=1 Tax=Leucobacter allii TaxID=2932247 RepID=A0ABY4FGL2_9MICO|nr:ferritin-like fold-containing protein [Leucobacter allii]UOQ55823.1 ferritin-like domain-containing protein [Leucobacter allii]UOR00335.1 ferritin-like domain-containing protein [Leucobacter allii]